MGGFWEEKIIELQQQPLPQRPAPQIPQAPPEAEDLGIDDLVARAKAATAQMTPAASVAERFGQAPGADYDVGIAAQRGFATDATPEPSLLDLTPQQRAELIRLGNAGGRFDEHGTAAAAHANAAMIAELKKRELPGQTGSEVMTPGRWVNPRGVAGHTTGTHGHQGR